MRPKNVATPLPPLNFNQIGYMWPKRAKIATYMNNSEENCNDIHTGAKPLRVSKKRVNRAVNLFPVLSTLVVPMFPEPISLISILETYFENKYPKGTDPIK